MQLPILQSHIFIQTHDIYDVTWSSTCITIDPHATIYNLMDEHMLGDKVNIQWKCLITTTALLQWSS